MSVPRGDHPDDRLWLAILEKEAFLAHKGFREAYSYLRAHGFPAPLAKRYLDRRLADLIERAEARHAAIEAIARRHRGDRAPGQGDLVSVEEDLRYSKVCDALADARWDRATDPEVVREIYALAKKAGVIRS